MCAHENVVSPRSKLTWYTFMTAVTGAFCVTLLHERPMPRIIPKHRRELEQLELTCNMSDLVIFAAPMVAGGKSLYYLTRPNGAVTKLDIRIQPPDFTKNYTQIYYLQSYKFKVFNSDIGCSFNCSDVVSEKLAKLTTNEFVVGPLDEEDHGEWLLTVYNRNNDSDLLEIRQKIYIKVTATINLDHGEVRLREGNAFEIGFPYAMKDIMKCELVVPSGSVSQLYKGRKMDLQTCRYEVSNVTKQDSGYWKIIGHGSILYRATLHVLIIPKNSTTTTKPEDGARTTTLATTFSYFLKFISIYHRYFI